MQSWCMKNNINVHNTSCHDGVIMNHLITGKVIDTHTHVYSFDIKKLNNHLNVVYDTLH